MIRSNQEQKIFRIGDENIFPLDEILQAIFEPLIYVENSDYIIKRDEFSIIIMDDNEKSLENLAINSILKCDCVKFMDILWIDTALESAGRPPPLFHTTKNSSPINELIDWVNGIRQQDLVVSLELMKGFENDCIIDLEGFLEVASRASNKFVRVSTSKFLNKMCILNKLMVEEHDCTQILNRDSTLRPSFSLNMSSLIGLLRFTSYEPYEYMLIGHGNRDQATSSKRWRLERFI